MNILVVTNEYPPKIGGAGIVVQTLVEYLAKNGNNIEVVTTTKIKNKKILYKLTVVPCYKKMYFISFFIFFLSRRIKQEVVINDFWPMVGLFMSGKFFFLKYTIYIHGIEKYLNNRFFGFVFSFIYKSIIKRSKKNIFVSKSIMKIFLEQLNIRDQKNMMVAYPPITINISKKINIRKKHNINKATKIFLSVSRVVDGKGYEKMIPWFNDLSKNRDLMWIIIGDGRMKEHYFQITQELKITKVFFCGEMPRGELGNYYKQADFFWLFPDVNEAFGLVFKEALHYGSSVITNKSPGVLEAISSTDEGVAHAIEEQNVVTFIGELLDGKNMHNNVQRSKNTSSFFFDMYTNC